MTENAALTATQISMNIFICLIDSPTLLHEFLY